MGKDRGGAGRTSRLAQQIEALASLDKAGVQIVESGVRQKSLDALAGLSSLSRQAEMAQTVAKISSDAAAHAAATAKAQAAFVDAGKLSSIMKVAKKLADPKALMYVGNDGQQQKI
jgi:isopropylmalate/homocitrate/citramalate synthase